MLEFNVFDPKACDTTDLSWQECLTLCLLNIEIMRREGSQGGGGELGDRKSQLNIP